jgi:hypothetical protein
MRSFWFYIVLLSLFPMLTGCHASQSEGTVEADHEHDPDDMPITEADVKMPRSYPEAVEQIVNYCDAIERAVSAGTPSKAHRPLDEAEIVLFRLTKIARDSQTPRRYWEEINVTSRQLRESLNEIHAAIDANQPPPIDKVIPEIRAALDRLRTVDRQLSNDRTLPSKQPAEATKP